MLIDFVDSRGISPSKQPIETEVISFRKHEKTKQTKRVIQPEFADEAGLLNHF